jgi:hypothetical protein
MTPSYEIPATTHDPCKPPGTIKITSYSETKPQWKKYLTFDGCILFDS